MSELSPNRRNVLRALGAGAVGTGAGAGTLRESATAQSAEDSSVEYTLHVTDSTGSEVGSVSFTDDTGIDSYGNHVGFSTLGEQAWTDDRGIVDYVRFANGTVVEDWEERDLTDYQRIKDSGGEFEIVDAPTANGAHALRVHSSCCGDAIVSNDQLVEIEPEKTLRVAVRNQTDNSGFFAHKTTVFVGADENGNGGIALRLINPGTQRTPGAEITTPTTSERIEFEPELQEFYTYSLDIASGSLATGTVTGAVTNEAGDSLAGVTIECVPTGSETPETTTTTDNSGNYEVELPVDTYEIVVLEDGFEPVSIPVAVEDGKTSTVDIELTPQNSSITISEVKVGPDSLLFDVGNDIMFAVGVVPDSDSSVANVEITHEDGTTLETQNIQQLSGSVLSSYLNLLGHDYDTADPEELTEAFEGLFDLPASNIYAGEIPREPTDWGPGDTTFEAVVTASDGSVATEQVSIVVYSQGATLDFFTLSPNGPLVEFDMDYFNFDHTLVIDDQFVPENLPVSPDIEVFDANIEHTADGQMDLNTLQAAVPVKSVFGVSVFGTGLEAQGGGSMDGFHQNLTYDLVPDDIWLAFLSSLPVPAVKDMKVKLPDNDYLDEVSIDLSVMPGFYLLLGDINPFSPEAIEGRDSQDEEQFVPPRAEYGEYGSVTASTGLLLVELFINGTTYHSADFNIDNVTLPFELSPVMSGGKLCLDGGLKVAIDPIGDFFTLETLAEVTPGFTEPCVTTGEITEPPCWEVFDIDVECGEYPPAEGTTQNLFPGYTIEDRGRHLRAASGSHPPADAVTAETETADVTRLTNRPERDAGPAVVARETTHLAVWESHPEGAPVEEGRDIVTAVRDGNGWSDSTALTDETGASYHGPAVAVAGGDAAIAWTRYDLDGVDELDEVDTMTRIEFTPEQGDGWGSPVVIEDTDAWLDRNTFVEPLADGWVVAWERTDPSDTGNRAIAYAVVDSAGSVERSETIEVASNLDLARNSEGVVLGYHDQATHQVRRDLVTETDRTQDATYDVNDDRSLRELTVSGQGTAWTVVSQEMTTGFYAADGTVEELDFVTAESPLRTLTLEETPIGTVLTDSRIPRGDVRARSVTYHLRVNGGWRPEQVPATTDATEDVKIREQAVVPTTDGEGLLTLLEAKVHDPDAVHDLFAVEQPFRPSYTITADAEQETVAPGEAMTVSYTIENTGDLDGDAVGDDPVPVEARSQGDTLAEQQETPLARGETATGELTFPLDDTGTVEIVVGRELNLLDPEERRTTIEGSSPRLGVDSVAVERPDEGTAIATIRIRNSGQVDADEFGIEVYAGDDTLLGEAVVDGPAAGERSSVTVEYDPSDLDLGRAEQVHIDPEEELPESHVSRRVSQVFLGQPDVTVDEEIGYSETDSGAVAQFGLTNVGPVSTQVVVRAVWADATPEDGSFADEDVLGTEEVALPAAIAGTPQSVATAVDLEGVAYGDNLRFIVESTRPVGDAGVPVVYDRVGPLGPEISPLPGFENAPQDLDNDNLYEDVDGDGEFDIFDVQAFFNNLDSDSVQNHPDAFNFNGDENPDEVTIFDVQGLFQQLQTWEE